MPAQLEATTAAIAERIRAGTPVGTVAADLGVTESSVYMRLRRAGTPVASLLPRRRGVEYRAIKGRAGYRAGSDGSIESCVSPRTGAHTEHWRPLGVRLGTRGNLYVQLGSGASGTRTRVSPRVLLIAAWGEAEGERIFERLRRRLARS